MAGSRKSTRRRNPASDYMVEEDLYPNEAVIYDAAGDALVWVRRMQKIEPVHAEAHRYVGGVAQMIAAFDRRLATIVKSMPEGNEKYDVENDLSDAWHYAQELMKYAAELKDDPEGAWYRHVYSKKVDVDRYLTSAENAFVGIQKILVGGHTSIAVDIIRDAFDYAGRIIGTGLSLSKKHDIMSRKAGADLKRAAHNILSVTV